MNYYLAIDLGATSGRHILAHEENGELILKEIHRFKTGMINSKDGLVWDIPGLYDEILKGIKKGFEITKDIKSLSIDSWGVDYVLMDGEKEIPPFYAYRNSRLDHIPEEVHKNIPFEKLYQRTGIQYAQFNTLYQLYADKKAGRLDKATDYLSIPEYFIYKLTGVKTHEYTFESTGALLDVESKRYDSEIINLLRLPSKLFKEIYQPGYHVGKLNKEVSNLVGGNCDVILCASHDTGSAFEAVDCPENSVIISSGTWSLLGVKNKKPITSKKSLHANFTNEGGVGYYRFLKNIMGMWIINEIARQKGLNLIEIASNLDNVKYKEIFDINDESLLSPSNMEKAVENLIKGEKPKNDYELFASVYHSLAFGYDKAIKELESITGETYKYIYIVGGGAKNKFLNKLVEQYTGKKVIALPIEATSIGNIKVQINAYH